MKFTIERLMLFLLIIILAVNTVIDTMGNQDIEDAVANTDLIAQCTTPGTVCSKLSAANRAKQEARSAAENKCVIETILDFPPSDQRAALKEQILAGYDECVARFSTPPTTTSPSRGMS